MFKLKPPKPAGGTFCYYYLGAFAFVLSMSLIVLIFCSYSYCIATAFDRFNLDTPSLFEDYLPDIASRTFSLRGSWNF